MYFFLMDFEGFSAKRFSFLTDRLPGGTQAYILLKWIILSNGTRLLDNRTYRDCNIPTVDLFRINKIQLMPI